MIPIVKVSRYLFLPGLLLSFLLSACSLDDNHAIAEYNQGNLEYFALDFKESQEHFERAVNQNPNLTMARNNLACSLFRQKEFQLAKDEFDKALAENPRFAKALYNRAIVNIYLGHRDRGLEDFDLAIRILEPELEKAKPAGKAAEPLRDSLKATREENYFGTKIGRLSTTATDSLEFRTIWLQHALVYVHNGRGMCLQKLRSYKGAINDFNYALKHNRDLKNDDSLKIGEILLNRGNCYQAMAIQMNSPAGDTFYDLAIRDYESAIRNPEDTTYNLESLFQKAVCLMGKGYHELAKAEFDTIILINPSDPRPYVRRANCLQALGDIDGAIKGYTEALDLNPKQADPLFNRGNCFNALGLGSMAIADYTACLDLIPDYANAWYMRGITRIEAGDHAGAATDLVKAGESGHPDAFAKLGMLEQLERNEDTGNAEEGAQ
jgi:tetratricopeptide (TPR) repeat protein